MALRPTARVMCLWRDASSSPGYSEAHTIAHEIGAVETRAASLAARVTAVSDASLIGYNIIYSWIINAAPPPDGPQPGNIRGLLVFECTGEQQYAIITIPGIKQELIDTQSPYLAIDTTAPEMVALIAHLTSGIYCNPFGEAITTLVNAYVEIIP